MKITQKETKNILINKKSGILYSGYIKNKNYNDIIQTISAQKIDINKYNNLIDFRTAKEAHSNYILFSDNSRVYFDNLAITKEYYINENILTIIEVYTGEYMLVLQYAIKD